MKKKEQITEDIPNNWVLFEGEWHDGLPIIIKVRYPLHSLIGSKVYPERYNITWSFQTNGQGHLFSSEWDSMEQFELKITDALEKNQQSVMVATASHAGERDWIFYTKDSEEAPKRLNIVLQKDPRYPIKIMACPDPNWEEYTGILVNTRLKR